ncbi:polyprenyl synthetase family protein [Thermodesulfobacteriota bacterium]
MFDLRTYLEDKRKLVNAALENMMGALPSSRLLTQAMRYSVMAGGKRLRPILCIAAAEAVGGSERDVLKVACTLEMIHTFSLIHDDLPALDDDDLRRGKPTCHKAFGEAPAILAGDALLNFAFQVLTEGGPTGKTPASDRLEVAHRIARAVGHMGMIEGQMRDMEGEVRALSLSELEAMHRLKTGAIIEVSVYAGARLGGGSASQISTLEEYAGCIGLAFQVTDDILNVEGDPALMGKAVGSDEKRNKSTYPSLLGMPGAKQLAGSLVEHALKALKPFDKRSDALRAVARYIIERKR